MTEPKAKSNPDYTASAVKLSNPESLKKAMENYHAVVYTARKLEEELETTETYKKLAEVNASINAWEKEIKDMIDQDGSYQDMELGVYAVKQRRASRIYNVQPFMIHFPEYTPEVLIEAIDPKRLEGLIKTGRVREDDLKERGVITEKETFVYIIK